MILKLKDQDFDLLPERAFYWPQEKILGLSDIHPGKAFTLQQSGIPVPSSDTEELLKIAQLISDYQPTWVFILGDFIHNKNSWNQQLFNEVSAFFGELKDIEWNLIIRNHERGSIDFLKLLPINIIEGDFKIGSFTLSHGHLKNTSATFTIQGHVHPVTTIRDGSTKLRLPYFVVSSDTMTIPSFGDLTGGFEMIPQENEKIFAVTSDSVFEMPRFI